MPTDNSRSRAGRRDRYENGSHHRNRERSRRSSRSQESQGKTIIIVAAGALLLGGGLGLYFAFKSPKKTNNDAPADPSKNTVVANPNAKKGLVKNPDTRNPNEKQSNGKTPIEKKADEPVCFYDDALTKYLPDITRRLEIVDFQTLHSNPWLESSYHGALERYSLGTWNHKEAGIGALKLAGVTEDSIKCMTFVDFEQNRGSSNLGFVRFTKAPDQQRMLQELRGKTLQVDGKSYYQLGTMEGIPLVHLHFLEPTLAVFGSRSELIPLLAEARPAPAVSPDLIQAIKATRGPLAVAAHRFTDGQVHFPSGLVNFFRFFTRADQAIVVLHEKAKWVAYSRIPHSDRMTVQVQAQFDDVASAQAAEKRASETAETLKMEPVQSIEILKESAQHMFKNVSCVRDGTLVTLNWPFTPLMVERFFGPGKNWR